jgi:hypothetical protein
MRPVLPAKQRGERAAEPASPLEDAIEQLYGAPLERFVPLRRELVARLRSAGDLPASRLLAAMNKPSRAAWALNQVARHEARRLRELFGAWDAAAAAQKEGDANQVRASTRQYRDRVLEVTNAARDLLAQGGANPNAVLLRQIGASLQAACAGGAETREQLLSGRLADDIDSEDPLAGLEMGPPVRRRTGDAASKGSDSSQRETDARVARERQRERQEREQRIDQARELVKLLDEKARAARAASRDAVTAAKRAETEAARASQAAKDADARLEAARAELKSLLDPHRPAS